MTIQWYFECIMFLFILVCKFIIGWCIWNSDTYIWSYTIILFATCVLVLSLFWNCLIVNLAKAGLFAALLGKLQCWKPMFPLPLRGSQAHTVEVQCVTQNEARKTNPFTWKIPTIRVHMIVAFGPSHAVKKQIRRKKHRAIVGHVQNPCRRCFHHCRSRLRGVCW